MFPYVKSELENVYALSQSTGRICEEEMKECWFPDLRQLKANLINIAYDSLHKSIISRELR